MCIAEKLGFLRHIQHICAQRCTPSSDHSSSFQRASKSDSGTDVSEVSAGTGHTPEPCCGLEPKTESLSLRDEGSEGQSSLGENSSGGVDTTEGGVKEQSLPWSKEGAAGRRTAPAHQGGGAKGGAERTTHTAQLLLPGEMGGAKGGVGRTTHATPLPGEGKGEAGRATLLLGEEGGTKDQDALLTGRTKQRAKCERLYFGIGGGNFELLH